jgi:hypothetical protein
MEKKWNLQPVDLWASSLNGKLQSPKRIYTRMEWRAQITRVKRRNLPSWSKIQDGYWTKRRIPFIGEATSKDTKIVGSRLRDRLSIEANKANYAPQVGLRDGSLQ